MDYQSREFAERLRQVMRIYLASGEIHAARFAQAQRELDLAAMLRPQVLLLAAARAQSRLKLATLRELFDHYKAYYAGFGLNISRDLLALTGDLPEDLRQALVEQATGQMQAHIPEQAQFYQWRERWFTAVFGLLEFFDGEPATAHIDDEGRLVLDGEEYETYARLAAEINEVARNEQELMRLRKARLELRRAAARL